MVGLPGVHIECKYVEHLNLYDAMAQAVHDAKESELAAVFHLKNHSDWLVTMKLSDWMKMYLKYFSGRSDLAGK